MGVNPSAPTTASFVTFALSPFAPFGIPRLSVGCAAVPPMLAVASLPAGSVVTVPILISGVTPSLPGAPSLPGLPSLPGAPSDPSLPGAPFAPSLPFFTVASVVPVLSVIVIFAPSAVSSTLATGLYPSAPPAPPPPSGILYTSSSPGNLIVFRSFTSCRLPKSKLCTARPQTLPISRWK